MSDTLSFRALEVNHPALAADAAIRRVAALEAEIAALRAAVRDANTIGVKIMPEPWRRKHAATIARAVEGRR